MVAESIGIIPVEVGSPSCSVAKEVLNSIESASCEIKSAHMRSLERVLAEQGELVNGSVIIATPLRDGRVCMMSIGTRECSRCLFFSCCLLVFSSHLLQVDRVLSAAAQVQMTTRRGYETKRADTGQWVHHMEAGTKSAIECDTEAGMHR